MTLRCQSASFFDAFLLSKEGEAGPPLHRRSQHQGGEFQADFPLRSVTLDRGGTYRCYGSLSSTPFLLSHPSDPLELVVTGKGLSECLPPHPSVSCLDVLPAGASLEATCPSVLCPTPPTGAWDPTGPGSTRECSISEKARSQECIHMVHPGNCSQMVYKKSSYLAVSATTCSNPKSTPTHSATSPPQTFRETLQTSSVSGQTSTSYRHCSDQLCFFFFK